MTKLLLARSEEHSFYIWHGFGRVYHAVLQPDSASALAGPLRPAMGSLLLETVATLNEELADAEILTRGERGLAGWCAPELLRISAKRLIQLGHADSGRPEALLLGSLDTARQQGALSWELRSAISLAELWQRQSRQDAARDLLAGVQDRFTEGFTTADLVSSAALLRDLRSSA